MRSCSEFPAVYLALFGAAPSTTNPRQTLEQACREAEAGARGTWNSSGWDGFPRGQGLRLRAGGLLWPEAQQRLANSAPIAP